MERKRQKIKSLMDQMSKKSLNIENSLGEKVDLEPHSHSCDLEDIRDYVKAIEKPVAIDLFCGAGGLSLGLEMAGFSVVLGVDYDKSAIQTHRAYFGGASIHADLSKPATIDQISKSLSGLDIALVAGGPPCQPFSSAGRYKIRSLIREGKRHHFDERSDLWRSFVEVVSRVKPKSVLIENVPDIISGKNQKVFRKMVSGLEQIGYSVHSRILPTWEYGVPQHRRRLIIVGLKCDARYDWPATGKDLVSVEEAISDLPPVQGGDFQSPRPYGRPMTPFQKTSRSNVSQCDRHRIFDHGARAVRKDDLEAFRLLGTGMKYVDLPDELKRYRSDTFKDKYNRLDWKGLSRTITAHIAKDGYWYIHPNQNRTISVREAARLQTFPDDFRFSGFRSNAFRQIGDAVPPVAARAVGSSILKSLREAPFGGSVSSLNLSAALACWIDEQKPEDMNAHWRKREDLWSLVLGQVVFQRGGNEEKKRNWKALSKLWPNPTRFLRYRKDRDDLPACLISDQVRVLEKIAMAITSRQELKAISGKRLGGLSSNQLSIAKLLSGIDDELPVQVGPTRVVARVFGQYSPDQDTTRMNGRLSLARALGIENPGRCYSALLEIADRFCGSDFTKCTDCPVKDHCCTARMAHNGNRQLELV